MYTYVHHCPTLLTPSHVRPKETSAGDARRGVVLARDAPDVGRRRGSRVGRVWVVDTTHTWVQSRVMTQKNYPTHLTDTRDHTSITQTSIDRSPDPSASPRTGERTGDRSRRTGDRTRTSIGVTRESDDASIDVRIDRTRTSIDGVDRDARKPFAGMHGRRQTRPRGGIVREIERARERERQREREREAAREAE